jgi:SAM-dependent methyltransferase
MNSGRYVQFGCGLSAPSSWRNFDASPSLRLLKFPLVRKFYKTAPPFPPNVEYGDIVKGLPIAAEACSAVYCSHVLEHLSLEDFRAALLNIFKILAPGGTFRFVLPDLLYLARQYLDDNSEDAASAFMRATHLGREKRAKSLKEFIVSWLGNNPHLWMWDYRSIRPELETVGFVGIRKAVFGDSADNMFREVEESDRWYNGLGIECKKPLSRP